MDSGVGHAWAHGGAYGRTRYPDARYGVAGRRVGTLGSMSSSRRSRKRRSGRSLRAVETLDVLELRSATLWGTAAAIGILGAVVAWRLPWLLPPVALVGASVAIAGLLIGIAATVVSDTLDPVVRGPRHVRSTGGELVAVLPPDAHPDAAADLAASILFAREPGRCLRLGLSAAGTGVFGVGPWADSIGVAIADQNASALVIDLASGSTSHDGLSEVVSGHRRLAEVVRRVDGRKLARLGPGRDPQLAVSSLPKLASRLPSDLDVLIVGLPPATTRAAIAATRAVDHVLVVAERDRTTQVEVMSALDAISQVNGMSQVVLLDGVTSRAIGADLPGPREPDDGWEEPVPRRGGANGGRGSGMPGSAAGSAIGAGGAGRPTGPESFQPRGLDEPGVTQVMRPDGSTGRIDAVGGSGDVWQPGAPGGWQRASPTGSGGPAGPGSDSPDTAGPQDRARDADATNRLGAQELEELRRRAAERGPGPGEPPNGGIPPFVSGRADLAPQGVTPPQHVSRTPAQEDQASQASVSPQSPSYPTDSTGHLDTRSSAREELRSLVNEPSGAAGPRPTEDRPATVSEVGGVGRPADEPLGDRGDAYDRFSDPSRYDLPGTDAPPPLDEWIVDDESGDEAGDGGNEVVEPRDLDVILGAESAEAQAATAARSPAPDVADPVDDVPRQKDWSSGPPHQEPGPVHEMPDPAPPARGPTGHAPGPAVAPARGHGHGGHSEDDDPLGGTQASGEEEEEDLLRTTAQMALLMDDLNERDRRE